MNALTTKQNPWIPATEAEKAAALVSLAGLPSRQTSSAELDRSAYYVALDGVTRHGLSEAVKFILRGALGHGFMPSPPELRLQCDKAMQWHVDEAERIRRREQIAGEQPKTVHRTPAEIERNKQIVAQLRRDMGWAEDENDPDAFRAAMEAKYGADALAKIPDNPNALTRMGKQAAE